MQLLLGQEVPDRILQLGPQDGDLDQVRVAGLKQLLVESKNKAKPKLNPPDSLAALAIK